MPGTHPSSVPDSWLAVPSHEIVLDLQHESLEYGARLDASEFLAAVLNVLLQANYTVRFSDRFIEDEIKYYRDNLSRDNPAQMCQGILNCLETARASGVLDWTCFNGEFSRSAGPTAAERHLPWMAPPFKANLLSLAGAAGTNLPCLHLSLKWAGRGYAGGVQHTRRPGGLMGESVLTEGGTHLWAFAAVMSLTKSGQTLFEKEYPREDWQSSYVTIYDRPLWKTSQAILQDLAAGLRPKPQPVAEPGRKKPQKPALAGSAR